MSLARIHLAFMYINKFNDTEKKAFFIPSSPSLTRPFLLTLCI